MDDVSRKQLVLIRLCDAARAQEQIEYPERSGNRLPPGEVPMPILQGKECGGSAANVRLNELRMPEERSKGRCGIPIEMNVRDYYYDGESCRVFTYKIPLKPENIDRFINIGKCALNKEAIHLAGGIIIEIDDDAGGRAKPGKAVRIVTQAWLEQHRTRRQPESLHPLAPQLPT